MRPALLLHFVTVKTHCHPTFDAYDKEFRVQIFLCMLHMVLSVGNDSVEGFFDSALRTTWHKKYCSFFYAIIGNQYGQTNVKLVFWKLTPFSHGTRWINRNNINIYIYIFFSLSFCFDPMALVGLMEGWMVGLCSNIPNIYIHIYNTYKH